MLYEIRYEANGRESQVSFRAASDDDALAKFRQWWGDDSTLPAAWVAARWSTY